MNLFHKQPVLGKDVFVAPNAVVVGDVELGNKASVYYGAVLRGTHIRLQVSNYNKPVEHSTLSHLWQRILTAGDNGKISVGQETNIQDGTVISTGSTSVDGHNADTTIGSRVTIGHQVSLHGVTIGDEALIGMGSTLLHGVKVEKGSMVAAGAVVAPGTVVPASEIWGGNPARHLRALKPEETKFLTGE